MSREDRVDGIPKVRDNGIEGGEVDGERWRKGRRAGQRGNVDSISLEGQSGFFSLEIESPKGCSERVGWSRFVTLEGVDE